jgi:predicted XRE-type DNA-binding protein
MSAITPWTADEVETLRQLYPTGDWPAMLAAIPRRTRTGIHRMAVRLQIKGASRGQRQGAYLGSVRCVESLRARCVVDATDSNACWHLKSARGKPMPTDGKAHCIWLHNFGRMTATVAAWIVSRGHKPPPGRIVFRGCESYDCVNPKHLKCGNHAALGRHVAKMGTAKNQPQRIAANAVNAKRRRKLTDEQARWARTCGLSQTEVAQVLGVSDSCIGDIRRGLRYRESYAAASVFSWRPA